MYSTDKDENLAELLGSKEGMQFILNESMEMDSILWEFFKERGKAITENGRYDDSAILDITIKLAAGIEREAMKIAARIARDEEESQRDDHDDDDHDDDGGPYGRDALTAAENRGVTGYAYM